MKKVFLKCNFIRNVALIVLVAAFFLPSNFSSAATMTLQSSVSKVAVDATFTVKVLVNSQNIYINNAEATIQFPSDLVQVVSVDSKSSVFSMWVEPPAFSNANGVITFNGGVTNPGYIGSGGTLLSVVFKAKAPGTASLFFSGPAVKASDGFGTDVLSGQNSTSITIVPNQTDKTTAVPVPTAAKTTPEKPTEAVKTTVVPPNLQVSSPTHPDQKQWYQLSDALVQWPSPTGVKAIQVLLSKQPNVLPTKDLPADTKSRAIKDIDDGISYFLVRYKTNAGWSDISTFTLKIDTQPPHNVLLTTSNNANGSTTVQYTAVDDMSGIKNYELSVDGGKQTMLPSDSQNLYSLSLAPGTHSLVLFAYDKAGNVGQYTSEVKVTLNTAPIINDYSKQVVYDGSLYALGTSVYPNTNFNITVKSMYGSITNYDVLSDDKGAFSFHSEPVRLAGAYELWAAAVNADGTKGPSSNKVTVVVEQKLSTFKQMLGLVSSPTMLLMWMILCVALLAAAGWYKYFIEHSRLTILSKKLEQTQVKTKIVKRNLASK